MFLVMVFLGAILLLLLSFGPIAYAAVAVPAVAFFVVPVFIVSNEAHISRRIIGALIPFGVTALWINLLFAQNPNDQNSEIFFGLLGLLVIPASVCAGLYITAD